MRGHGHSTQVRHAPPRLGCLLGRAFCGPGLLRVRRAVRGLRIGGPGRWVEDAALRSLQLALGWGSRRTLHRLRNRGAVSRYHVAGRRVHLGIRLPSERLRLKRVRC